MTNYKDVLSNVSSRLKEAPEPVSIEPQKEPQVQTTENTLNNIGLAINREGGMNN